MAGDLSRPEFFGVGKSSKYGGVAMVREAEGNKDGLQVKRGGSSSSIFSVFFLTFFFSSSPSPSPCSSIFREAPISFRVAALPATP